MSDNVKDLATRLGVDPKKLEQAQQAIAQEREALRPTLTLDTTGDTDEYVIRIKRTTLESTAGKLNRKGKPYGYATGLNSGMIRLPENVATNLGMTKVQATVWIGEYPATK